MIDKLKLELPEEAEVLKVRETRYSYIVKVRLTNTEYICMYTLPKCFDPNREERVIRDAVKTIMANLYFKAGITYKVVYYLSMWE